MWAEGLYGTLGRLLRWSRQPCGPFRPTSFLLPTPEMLQQPSCAKTPRHSLENGHQPGSAGAERQVMAHCYGGQSKVSMDRPHDKWRNLPLVCACIILGFLFCLGKFNLKGNTSIALNHCVNLDKSLPISGKHLHIHCGRCRGDVAHIIMKNMSFHQVHI